MPITITLPPAPDGSLTVGPGILIRLQSDFIGPLPSGTDWVVTFAQDAEFLKMAYEISVRTTVTDTGLVVLDPRTETVLIGQDVLTNSSPVHVQARLRTPTSIIDSGVATGKWTTDAGLGLQAVLQPKASVGGGLTDEQATQLANTDRRTTALGEPLDWLWQTASGPLQVTLGQIFSRKTLDTLTLDELTNGETCEPLRVHVDEWFHAVIVRVTTIDPALTPKTPDSEWYFPDLAVLRVFRGEDLEFRRGIHTPTFLQEKPWQWGWWFDAANPIYGVPPELTVAVDWRPGCCGQVFLMRLP